jgi:tRNA pseudouridine38-40 synthase
MINYKMTIGYDGRRYKGYRKTKSNEDKTIQGKLEAILEKKYGEKIEVVSAVNTDAGVSATYQVVNFKVPDKKEDEKGIRDYFEEFLPDDIITYSVEAVEDRFHSRYNVKELTYEYRLWKIDAPRRPLFDRQYVNRMDGLLDVDKMRDAAELFLGEHEFAAFSTKSKVKSSVKTITSLELFDTDEEIIVTISADGFLLNMGRIIVGTLIQIGLGTRHEETIKRAFKSMNNKDVGHKAMASALTLVNVEY